MKHRIKQIMLLFAVFMVMIIYMPREVYASDGTISISSTASTTGNEVSVSVNVSGNAEIGTVDLWLTYDSSIIEAVSGFDGGGGGRIHILSSDNTSFTVKFKTVGVGDSTINIDTSTTYVYNYNPADGDYMNYSVSPGKVSVNAPKTYSANNNLKSLAVSPGTLTPQFQTSVTEYNLTVPQDCERLNVSAQTEDTTATVSVSGTQMDYGDNTTYIKVTAENGETKTYVIYTKREGEAETETKKEEEEQISVTVNGETYNVNTDYETHPLPEGFEEKEYVYKGKTIKAGIGISKKLVIFYLENEGNGSFYIYNEDADTFYKMINLSQAQGIYTIIDFKDGEVEIPEGYEETDEIIDGVSRKVYVGEDKNSYLIYLMNYNGDCGWYRVDRTENTIQRYFAENISGKTDTTEEVTEPESDMEQKIQEAKDQLAAVKTENQRKTKQLFVAIIILIVALVLVIFAFAAYILKIKSKKEDTEVLEEEKELDTANNTVNSETDNINNHSVTNTDTYAGNQGIIEKDEKMLGDSVAEIIEEWDNIKTDTEDMDKTQYLGTIEEQEEDIDTTVNSVNNYEEIELNKIYEDTDDEDNTDCKSDTKIVINDKGETIMIRDGVEVQDDDFIDLDDN